MSELDDMLRGIGYRAAQLTKLLEPPGCNSVEYESAANLLAHEESRVRALVAALEARAERAERERDEARALAVEWEDGFATACREHRELRDSLYSKLKNARAWARRWKRAAKDTRGQRQVLQDILNTTIETTNADLKDLRARLEKWRTAERTEFAGFTVFQHLTGTWAKVPEGEE